MIRRLCVLVLIASPVFAAASKEILELQRDVANLQDLVKQLQQSQDKQLAAITALVGQSLDAVSRANSVVQTSLQQNNNQLKTDVVGPVVGLNTRMDQVSGAVSTLQTAVSELTNAINRIQAQMTDVSNAIKVLQQPPPPPPTQSGTTPGGSPAPADAAPAVPPVNASDTYNSAQVDRQSGKLDFALAEYANYLKYFGNTNLAPSAQYYIGWIHYSQKNYEAAVADFNTLLEKYPDTPSVTAQAHYYKGKSQVALGQRTPAVAEFNEVIKKYPGTDNAVLACTELKDLGMHCPAPGPARSLAGKKKD